LVVVHETEVEFEGIWIVVGEGQDVNFNIGHLGEPFLKEIERRVKRPLGTVKNLLVFLSKEAPTSIRTI
jgi:hypothetical protein